MAGSTNRTFVMEQVVAQLPHDFCGSVVGDDYGVAAVSLCSPGRWLFRVRGSDAGDIRGIAFVTSNSDYSQEGSSDRCYNNDESDYGTRRLLRGAGVDSCAFVQVLHDSSAVGDSSVDIIGPLVDVPDQPLTRNGNGDVVLPDDLVFERVLLTRPYSGSFNTEWYWVEMNYADGETRSVRVEFDSGDLTKLVGVRPMYSDDGLRIVQGSSWGSLSQVTAQDVYSTNGSAQWCGSTSL